MAIWLAIVVGVVALDQLTKILVINFLDRGNPLVIIEGVFRFSYVENRGAAFGMLADNRWVFMIISTVGILALLVYLWKFSPESKIACTALSMIIGGGIGNMIDRICYSYVIDFLDFCAFPEIWPWVFNVADSFVCIGAAILIIWCIFSIFDEAKKEKAKKATFSRFGAGVELKDEQSNDIEDAENEQESDSNDMEN